MQSISLISLYLKYHNIIKMQIIGTHKIMPPNFRLIGNLEKNLNIQRCIRAGLSVDYFFSNMF